MGRKAVVTAGVSYHHALTQPGQPLADFEPLDVYALAHAELSAYDLVLVLRSVDAEALWARRHQVARFLEARATRRSSPATATSSRPTCPRAGHW